MFGSLSTKIAHSTITPGLGSQDLRLLQEAINKEKDLVTGTQRFSKDLGIAADALKQWAAGEGEDLSDVASGSNILISHLTAAINTFSDHETVVRSQLKEIRTKEEQLDDLRKRRKAVGGKLEAQEKRLSKMGSENKALGTATEQLSALQNELRLLDTSILVDMARLSDHKRRITRSALTLQFGGLVELGEKFTIIGELGKLVAAEVPQDVTPPGQGRAPYPGREAVSNLVAEAARCVAEVTFNANPDTDFSSRAGHAPPRFQGAGGGSSMHHEEISAVPSEMRYPAGEHEGMDASRFKEQSNANPSIGQFTPQQSFSSQGTRHTGTMPSSNDARREYTGGTGGGGPAGPAPVDEFGRPIDGLPISANTMPAMGGNRKVPIQQLPLSAIQHSMRPPHSPGGPDAFVPTHGGGGGSGSNSGFMPPGAPSQMGRSAFNAPPPPPNLAQTHHQQQQQQQQHDTRLTQSVISNQPPQRQDPSSRFAQQPAQGRMGAAVERGLTLSLPIHRASTPAGQAGPGENAVDSPFVPPPNVNAAATNPNAPSAFKPPASQQMTRQGTTDSDIVLAEGTTDLQRTTTLPPKIGFEGDFPEWSLGLGELGLDGDSPTKEVAEDPLSKSPPVAAAEKKDLPEPPPVEATRSRDGSPVSAVPRSLREGGGDGTSQTSTPITQTPTTYSNAQTPTTYTTNPDGPQIIHDHVVDNPNTRTSGNSGRFAMFPDKRKGTSQISSERADSVGSESLGPPHAKFTSHPGVDRTPSPYPAGVSPVPTPGSERQLDLLPINVGASMTPEERPVFVTPATTTADAPPRSILLDSAHSHTGSMGGARSDTVGSGTDGGGGPRLRFAPRPPSPITPSPVTPGNPAWASEDSFNRGESVGSIGLSNERGMQPGGYMEAGREGSGRGSEGGAQRADNRLSVITPLGIHKNKEGGSHPASPHQGVFNDASKPSEMTDDQFNAMLDSFSAQVGSPGSASNPPSGVDSGGGSSFSYRSNADDSLGSSQGPSHVKNFLASSGGGPDSSRGSSSAQESSLDSTAAVAGSPFPSPAPPSQVSSQTFQLADMPRQTRGDMSGNFAGVGSSAFGGPRDIGMGHRRAGSGASDGSDSAPPRKGISAGAFRRGGDKAVVGGAGSTSSPARSPVPSPRQSYQSQPTGPPSVSSITTPRQDYRSVSPPTSVHSGYGGGGGGQVSNYQTPMTTPNPVPGDMNSLPPGAAAPNRYGGPGTQPPPSQQQYQQGSPHWAGGDIYAAQGRTSPNQAPSPSTRIPTSLMPGRPGSASPLAPIGHTQPPSSTGYQPHPAAPGLGAYAGSGPGYSTVPPWQQQQQQQQRAPPATYRGLTPGMAEYEGSVTHEDAYGGIDILDPPASHGSSSQHGGYHAPPGGTSGYGQGGWNGR